MILLRFYSALLLLLISLVLTSGAASAAALLLHEGTQSTCCINDNTDSSTPDGLPCSMPECQCISCLTFVVPAFSYPQANNGYLPYSSFKDTFGKPSAAYIKAIEYPPEHS